MTFGYWVRDLLHVWHKASLDRSERDGRFFVRCLASAIDIDESGLPGAGAVFCGDCLDALERDKRAS